MAWTVLKHSDKTKLRLFLIPCRRQARNLCDGDVVCVCVCMCVCVCVCMCVCDAFACKHDISRRVSVTNLIFGVWVGHIE